MLQVVDMDLSTPIDRTCHLHVQVGARKAGALGLQWAAGSGHRTVQEQSQFAIRNSHQEQERCVPARHGRRTRCGLLTATRPESGRTTFSPSNVLTIALLSPLN